MKHITEYNSYIDDWKGEAKDTLLIFEDDNICRIILDDKNVLVYEHNDKYTTDIYNKLKGTKLKKCSYVQAYNKYENSWELVFYPIELRNDLEKSLLNCNVVKLDRYGMILFVKDDIVLYVIDMDDHTIVMDEVLRMDIAVKYGYYHKYGYEFNLIIDDVLKPVLTSVSHKIFKILSDNMEWYNSKYQDLKSSKP